MLVLGSAGACSAHNQAFERELTELRDKVTILRNERDQLEERLAAVERRQHQLVSSQAGVLAARKPAPRVQRPPLKTVVLRPEASADIGSDRTQDAGEGATTVGVKEKPDANDGERPTENAGKDSASRVPTAGAKPGASRSRASGSDNPPTTPRVAPSAASVGQRPLISGKGTDVTSSLAPRETQP